MRLSVAFLLATCGSAAWATSLLEVTKLEIASGPIAVGGDGTVWALDPQQRLICFCDGQWKTADAEPNPRVRTLVPGREGVLLLETEVQLTLYRLDQKIASGGLLELIEEQRELICRAFGPGTPPPSTRALLMLCASRDGRVWCVRDRSLRVLGDDRWHDALDPLVEASVRNGMVAYLAPIGDGNTVYASDLRSLHDQGGSCFGRLEQGKLRFVKAPHTISGHGPYLGVRDREGALWIPATQGRAAGTSDIITGQIAIRIRQQGAVEQLVNSGHARLADEAGNVWLGEIHGKPPDLLNIWRDGEIVQQLHVPAYKGGLLFSDRPGSVFARTAEGLQHLVADPPDFVRHRVGRLYALPDVLARAQFEGHSSQGYLVISAARPIERAYFLHLVALPEPSEE